MSSSRIGDWRKIALNRLNRPGCDQNEATLDWLLAHVLKQTRSKLPLLQNTLLNEEQEKQLESAVQRLLQNEPLQYILGETDFWGLRIRCDRRALIPRPETEQLVDWVLQDGLPPSPIVADIGTGTGCILLALASCIPKGTWIGIDRSSQALELARENHRVLLPDTPIQWIESCLSRELKDHSVDVMVSNLPYISKSDWARLPANVREYEPAVALVGGEKGTEWIEALVPDAERVLRPGGRLYLEIGEQQEQMMHAIFNQTPGWDLVIRTDYAGRVRMLRGAYSV